MQNVNFLPERIKAQRHRRRQIVKQTYMLTVCLAGLALLGYMRDGRVRGVQAELAQLGEREADISLQLQRRTDLERVKADLYVIQQIDEQLGSRLSIYMLLSEMQRLLRQPMVLTQLSIETIQVANTDEDAGRVNRTHRPHVATRAPGKSGSTVTRLRLTLTGLAREDVDVANFIGQLSACPLFKDVNMGYSKDIKIGDRTARQFQASCYVVR